MVKEEYSLSTKYKHYTDEQKETARQTDIAALLMSQGEDLKRAGAEYEWYDSGQKITIRGNLWYNQYEQEGGDAIDFVRRFYNKNYPEAVDYLLGGCQGTLIRSEPVKTKPKEPFVLPKRNYNMDRVFAYLIHQRGIDRDVLYSFVHHRMIYESKNKHNAVFVGYDADRIPRHAQDRKSTV